VIEKRLIQWYASDAGVDLDVAEREVVLTYVLRILAEAGWLQPLAFKGGAAIRKLHLGNQGRFSMELDYSADDALDPRVPASAGWRALLRVKTADMGGLLAVMEGRPESKTRGNRTGAPVWVPISAFWRCAGSKNRLDLAPDMGSGRR